MLVKGAPTVGTAISRNIMTSWHENVVRITDPLLGEIHGSQMDSFYKGPIIQSFEVIFVGSLNMLLKNKTKNKTKQKNKNQRSCSLFETPWRSNDVTHYCYVIMGAMASHITGVSIFGSTVGSGADQRKHQNSASLIFVREIDWWWIPSTKGQ